MLNIPLQFTLRQTTNSMDGESVIWVRLLSPILALLISFVISSLLLLTLNYPVFPLFYIFFLEPLSSLYSLSEVLMKASVLVFIAWGLSLCFRANLWNIGAEGQFVFGGISASLVALYFHGQEGFFILPLMIFFGALGGALWAAVPAFLKSRFDANEILTSLMLVYIAELFLSYLVYGPLKNPNGFNFPQSVMFSPSAIYPYLIEGTRLSMTPILALIFLPLFYLLVFRSYFGYQLRVVGFSNKAANYGGISSKKVLWISFLICGAMTGFAAASELSSSIKQLLPDISPGYGFTAIIVAFLGRLHPIGIVFSSLLMALIYIGAEGAQIKIGLPVAAGGIFQGMLLFSLLISDYLLCYRVEIKIKKQLK